MSRTQINGWQAVGPDGLMWVFPADKVDAALAEKDAEIARLRQELADANEGQNAAMAALRLEVDGACRMVAERNEARQELAQAREERDEVRCLREKAVRDLRIWMDGKDEQQARAEKAEAERDEFQRRVEELEEKDDLEHGTPPSLR